MSRWLAGCAATAMALGLTMSASAGIPGVADETRVEAEVGPDGFAVFRWLVSLGLGESARERLVGKGGRWEQAPVPCETPRVYLALEPDEQTFELTIDSRCRGQSHVAEFEGRWQPEGSDRLVLIFEADEGDDETLSCSIYRCEDEDCVACQPAPDLAFELRVVRR